MFGYRPPPIRARTKGILSEFILDETSLQLDVVRNLYKDKVMFYTDLLVLPCTHL